MAAKNTKKTASKSATAKALPKTAAGLGKADPIPSTIAPTPPADYDPAVLRGPARPPLLLVQAAPGMLKELKATPSLAGDLGARAPVPAVLAVGIEFALGWTDQLLHAEAWHTYVKEQTKLAWQQSAKGIDALVRTFTFAAEGDSTLATTYPGIAKFVDARGLPGKLGNAVQKERRKATKKADAGPPPPPTPTQDPAAKDTVH
jgi:hypothetical protein